MAEGALNGIRKLLNTPEPAELGSKRRAGTQSQVALNAKLDDALLRTKLPSVNQQLVRALILLWHDHLDASHEISQGTDNPDGSFIHAIMHRREPDYWNSKYWWRRVGHHPAFSEITRRVGSLLKERRAGELAKKLLPDGKWDALAFVDACEEAVRDGSTKQEELLRTIQRIEFEVLLSIFAGSEQ